jgi:hypothetical protein
MARNGAVCHVDHVGLVSTRSRGFTISAVVGSPPLEDAGRTFWG